MFRSLISTALVLFAAGCATSRAAEQSDSHSEASARVPSELRFGWDVPSRVRVTEKVLKEGERATLRYDAVLEQGTEGKLHLRLERFEFVELEGVDLEAPELQEELKMILALTSAMPVLVIAADGQPTDVIGFEEMIEKVLATLPAQNAQTQAAVEARLRSPRMQATLKTKVMEFWRVWVATWIGMPTAPEVIEKRDMKSVQPDGTLVVVPLTLRSLGPDSAKPGSVRLEAESVLDGEAPRLAMGRFLQELSESEATQPKKPFTPDMIEKVRRESRITAVIDATSMRTLKASSEAKSTVVIRGEAEQSSIERHEYEFAWPAP